MPTVALMWEAKAAPGRAPELLAWARGQDLAPAAVPCERREHFTAPGERVLVITWWEGGYDAEVPELPDPPAQLSARPVHRWRFERV
ncbi:hypothetical protein JW613_24310 [Streptomyces smyrnaeus]|uniref:Uncharacterized protein n=1 Tax=Streptomyces smyrnaeus TaxID=1387713 RepID=A0ABS3Y170_9ACTN|nr:hypothetical protein [Streptomyces smyrnaeus]MBO8201394.1 hypothetical protein [Streptomyces smyrnaeus]